MSSVKNIQLDSMYKDVIIGIDLGTTNSAVAVYSNGRVPNLCPTGSGGKTTIQSCVKWDGDNSFTVGPDAYAERYKSNVIYSVKRLMGSSQTVKLERQLESGGIESIELTPVQVSAEILKELKRIANESYPGVYRCVITVPAYFNQKQIEDTIEASKIADLDCVQILKEPTSASYIYSKLGYAQDGSVMIYDLGGGTFDVTVMSFLEKAAIPKKMITSLARMYDIDVNSMGSDSSSLYFCRVLGTYGDTKLGGDDVDTAFAKLCAGEERWKKMPSNVREELCLRCEQFKKNGAAAQSVRVGGEMFDLNEEHLNRAISMVFMKTMDIVDQIPRDEIASVKTIVLVGGSTKSDYLVSLLENAFPGKEISRVLDPDSTVALGAGSVAKDLQEGKSQMYQDVLPMAIGVMVNESLIDICIPKNTALPYCASRTYYTMHDNQTSICVDVYQGTSTNPRDCSFLGTLRIDDLPAKKAGEIDVKVTFVLTAYGRLKVVTEVNSVSQTRELVVDSIYNVSKENEKVQESFAYDDFERAISDVCLRNSKVAALVLKRRELLEKGNKEEADIIEYRILEAM